MLPWRRMEGMQKPFLVWHSWGVGEVRACMLAMLALNRGSVESDPLFKAKSRVSLTVSQTSISLHGVQISSKGSALGLTGLYTDIRGKKLVVECSKLGVKLIKFGVKLGVNLV